MQLKNSNLSQKSVINTNSYSINQKSKSKQKTTNKIMNIKSTNKRISQSQNNKNLYLDNSFNVNNSNRNNSEKIRNNKK